MDQAKLATVPELTNMAQHTFVQVIDKLLSTINKNRLHEEASRR
jgi:hypothetical protein